MEKKSTKKKSTKTVTEKNEIKETRSSRNKQ